MNPDIVLVAYRPATGEIINRDGSIGGKVVPKVDLTNAVIELPDQEKIYEVLREFGYATSSQCSAMAYSIKAQMPKGE